MYGLVARRSTVSGCRGAADASSLLQSRDGDGREPGAHDARPSRGRPPRGAMQPLCDGGRHAYGARQLSDDGQRLPWTMFNPSGP